MNAVASRDEAAIIDWRVWRLMQMGFLIEDARILGESSADLHEVEDMIKRGCRHDLVAKIVL